MAQERLQKIISAAGVLSRRKAEAAILDGRVKLNGMVVTTLGTTADPVSDLIELDGVPVKVIADPKTFVFYKPRGVITTKSDDRGRKTVMDFFQDVPSVNPVGRLDFESEGLLLMSEDGQLLLRLTHPRYGFQKVYEVTLKPSGAANALSQSDAQLKLLSSVELEDGAGKFDTLDWKPGSLESRVTVSEGRNRFVRRMFEAVGYTVTRLKRIQMGPIHLGDLKPGERRELNVEEKLSLQSKSGASL